MTLPRGENPYSETGPLAWEIPSASDDFDSVQILYDDLEDSSNEDILQLLKNEKAHLKYWVSIAREYYRRGRFSDFENTLDTARKEANITYDKSEEDQMEVFDSLAAYYVQLATKEKKSDKKRELFAKATQHYIDADKINMYNPKHLLGRAYFCLYEGDKMDQANNQFDFVLNQEPHNIPSLLGKACIAYNKKEYRIALTYYKKALRTNPGCPADVRYGLGLCFFKLGNEAKARAAFERALELDDKCVGALVGLAIMDLNEQTRESIQEGVRKLSKAYAIDPSNPMVLNQLGNHFFYKKDYNKVQHLALHAFHNTENEAMRAESCYHLARAFHAQEDFTQAFQYYYQATQFAPPNFVLPYFGLGQLYINRGDTENAAQCFERVLKAQPGNYETMRILGALYANSDNEAKREIAKSHLKKVTDQFSDDVEAWMELSQILVQSDLQASLNSNITATKIFTEKMQVDFVPPQLYNNRGSLLFQVGDPREAKNYFEEALKSVEKAQAEDPDDEDYYKEISYTIRYNIGLMEEALCQYDKAEQTYKSILADCPYYTHCYLRMGCMLRDRGQIYEASDKFKEPLQFSNEDPDAWTLIGNLHLTKMEWQPGQKKFERILKQPQTSNDAYSHIALGNVWLQTLHQPMKDKDKEKKYQERALTMYKQVLRNHPKNIWAANGIGAVLAHKGYINEARVIFAEVREATAEFCDVWLNIAHVYVDQKQYVAAIQMYENCLKKFYPYPHVDTLLYLARAYSKSGKLKEAKMTLLKARRVAPHDTVLLYNIALILQRLASQILRDEKSTLNDVLQAVHELGLSHKYFQHLAVEGDRMKFDLGRAQIEAKQCQDLLSQAQYHVARARKVHEEEEKLRKKQKEEREKLKRMQLEMQREVEERKRQKKEEEAKLRQDYIEKMKQATIIDEIDDKPAKKSQGRRQKGADGEIVSSGSEDEGGNKAEGGGDRSGDKKRKSRSGKEGKMSRRARKKAERAERKKEMKAQEEGLSSKQKKKIVSRAMLSSSDSDSDGGNEKLKIASDGESDSGGAGPSKKRRIGSSSSEGEDDAEASNKAKDRRSRSGSRSSAARSRSGSASSRSKSRSVSRSRSRSRSVGSRSRSPRSRSGSRKSRSGSPKSRSASRSVSRSRSRSKSKSVSRSRSRSKSKSRSRSRSSSSSSSGSKKS